MRQTCIFKKVKSVPYTVHHPCLRLARVKPLWAVAHVNSIIKQFYEFGVLGERQIFGIQVGPYDETQRYRVWIVRQLIENGCNATVIRGQPHTDGSSSCVAPNAGRTPWASIMLYGPRVKVIFGDWEAEDFDADFMFLV